MNRDEGSFVQKINFCARKRSFPPKEKFSRAKECRLSSVIYVAFLHPPPVLPSNLVGVAIKDRRRRYHAPFPHVPITAINCPALPAENAHKITIQYNYSLLRNIGRGLFFSVFNDFHQERCHGFNSDRIALGVGALESH